MSGWGLRWYNRGRWVYGATDPVQGAMSKIITNTNRQDIPVYTVPEAKKQKMGPGSPQPMEDDEGEETQLQEPVVEYRPKKKKSLLFK